MAAKKRKKKTNRKLTQMYADWFVGFDQVSERLKTIFVANFVSCSFVEFFPRKSSA